VYAMTENSAETANETAKPKRRGPGRPFPKGRSGNPGGRPKVYAEFQELCRSQTPEAIATLVSALKAGDASSVAAARVLLEYGWGKPPSAPADLAAAKAANPFAGMSLEEIHKISEKVEEE